MVIRVRDGVAPAAADHEAVDRRGTATATETTSGPQNSTEVGPASVAPAHQELSDGWKRRSRRLFATTNTLENAIAAPAIMGLSSPSAASGSAATL